MSCSPAAKCAQSGRICRALCSRRCGIVVTSTCLANVAYLCDASRSPKSKNAPQNRARPSPRCICFGTPGNDRHGACDHGCKRSAATTAPPFRPARVYLRRMMARDALFFRGAATTNRHHAPAIALATQGVWAAFLTLPRTVITNPTTGAITYGNAAGVQLLEHRFC